MSETKTYRPYPGALLNPRLDANFKALFTDNSPEGDLARVSFISAMTGKQVLEASVTNNEPPETSVNDKNVRFDVAVIFNDGERAEIEMQGQDTKHTFNNRITYLASRLMVANFQRGEDYDQMKKIYQISVCNFTLNSKSKIMTRYNYADLESKTILSDKAEIITLELTKLPPKNNEIKIKDLSTPEKWAKFFLDADKPEMQSEIKNLTEAEAGIMAAQTVLNRISEDEKAWKRQFDADVVASDRATMLGAARREGEAMGVEKGIAKGIAQQKAKDQKIIDEKDAIIEQLRREIANLKIK